MFRTSQSCCLRVLLRMTNQIQKNTSSASVGISPVPCEKQDGKSSEEHDLSTHKSEEISSAKKFKESSKIEKSSLVAAVFSSLKSDLKVDSISIFQEISSAKNVSSLLKLCEKDNLSPTDALHIISVLNEWTASNKVKQSEYESDARFIKLCKIAGKPLPKRNSEKTLSKVGDLAMVLGVTGDDEAAKLIGTISQLQMIKVMSTLANKKKRSVPLLRSLAMNISSCDENLNLKECGDILFSLSVLNFPDEVLIEKVCSNINSQLKENKKSSVVRSVLTSLGLLRYKDAEVLDNLVDWAINNQAECRCQDITSLLYTLAVLGHVPSNAEKLFTVILPQLSEKDVPNCSDWLDVVWSLTVLERANSEHVASVLSKDFIRKLKSVRQDKGANSLNIASKLKLLNINAAAKLLLSNYKGPELEDTSEVYDVPLIRSKEKQQLVDAIFDTFSNLLPSTTYFNTNINTGMGFLLDGECLLDSKCNPLPIMDPKGSSGKKTTKVAILVWDYHDICRGRHDPLGIGLFNSKLLTRKGYKLLIIPYNEFNPKEKLVRRVQYLEQQLKALVLNS